MRFENLIGPHRHRWIGLVNPSEPFQSLGGKGDSGALVYAYARSVKEPLGIVLGTLEDYNYRYMFASLETSIMEISVKARVELAFDQYD